MRRLMPMFCLTAITASAQAQPAAPAPMAPAVAVVAPVVAPTPPPPSKHIKLTFRTRPNAKATVRYGRKLLGTTPFTIRWKRDSGPLDVVVRAGGYFPVSTRAYTFEDETVTVRLTPLSKGDTLFGYKRPLPPDAGVFEEADDGVAPSPASAPMPTPAPTPAPMPTPTPTAP